MYKRDGQLYIMSTKVLYYYDKNDSKINES